MALWDKDLPPMWLPQIPSCKSSRSNSDASGWMLSRYGPEKERLYNFWSLDSQKRDVFLFTLLASDLSSGKMPSLRNNTIGSIQLSPTLTRWTWTIFLFTSVGLHKFSIRITLGKPYAEEVASVARESACVFSLLGTCSRLKDSNLDSKCLTWLKYLCILLSFASSSPFTWPTNNLEFENIFIAFHPIFWTMDIPSNKASYSHYLWLKSPILMISQWWASQERLELALL